MSCFKSRLEHMFQRLLTGFSFAGKLIDNCILNKAFKKSRQWKALMF